MITELHISNYALIDSIDISFGPGLNIITGETGAGKSIILGALGLLLGARADNKVIRYADRKSVVEATFALSDNSQQIKSLLEEAEIENPADVLVLRRELSSNGRNRAFINDSLVNLTQLQRVASGLIDIHSQHQNTLLADRSWQLKLIDSLADNSRLNTEFSEAYTSYRQALRRYKQEKNTIEQLHREEEFLRFRHAQLAEAELTRVDEVEMLEAEQRKLENAASIMDSLSNIRQLLSDEEAGAISSIAASQSAASQISGMIADNISAELEQRLESLRIELDDIADAYENIADSIDANPAKLDRVNERLNLLYSLLQRNNAANIEELIKMRDSMAERLRKIDLSEDTLRSLEIEAKRAKKRAITIAAELTSARSKQAIELAKKITEQARPLGMDNLKTEIMLSPTALGPDGCDNVDFMFAFNKNQNLSTVAASASGGEISRLMLAIKSLAADALQLPTIVFDEVDTGVSGAIAARMGNLMKTIAKGIQVIAITHLPQVAALGNQHYKVYKHDTEELTLTSVIQLNVEQRIEELAKMLSGSDIDEAAKANARALLHL